MIELAPCPLCKTPDPMVDYRFNLYQFKQRAAGGTHSLVDRIICSNPKCDISLASHSMEHGDDLCARWNTLGVTARQCAAAPPSHPQQ